ncbi:MAG: hypothetical protein HYZ39_21165 [Mycolicibacterium cosmeticum]|nr:hypothetical protein [Mycolicibacterium cosmeticum]
MTSPMQPRILAEQGGLVIAENGAEILVFDRGGGAAQITTFVLGVLTLVCGGFGVVSLFAAGVPVVVSLVVLALGLAFGAGLLLGVRSILRRRRAPLSAFTAVAVFDRAHRIYRDGAGAPVAPLDQVRFERRMQATSSSAMLVALTPAGTRVLKRGNPFGGSVGSMDQVLTGAVFAQPR